MLLFFTQCLINKLLNISLIRLYIPLNEDRLIWRKEKNGEYSVRSAYHLCMNELLDTSHSKKQGSWQLLWNLKAPPKFKKLLWHICRNCLPTKWEFETRGLIVLLSALYIILRRITFISSLDVQTASIFGACGMLFPLSAAYLIRIMILVLLYSMFLQVLAADGVALFGCLLWSIWKQRNNKIWNDITDAQSYVFDRAKTMLEDWKTTRSIQDTSSNRQQSEQNVKWMKPNSSRVKCYIDTSFCKLTNRFGIGVCIRDENGHFVPAKTEWFSPICEVHVGQVLGLLSALEWVHVLNLGPVDFEMDAKRVVDNFHSQTNDVTEFGNIIDNCKSLFRNFTKTHVSSLCRDKQMRLLMF